MSFTFSRKEQEKLKPKIEDFILEHIDGNTKEIVLDFVAFLRENNMPPKWCTTNGWTNGFCQVELLKGSVLTVLMHLTRMNEYEEVIMNEGLQDLICGNVFYCAHDPKSPLAGKGCNPKKRCAYGRKVTVLDKELSGVCPNRPIPVFEFYGTPDTNTLNSIKRLLELEKMAREADK